ncbi:MAG: PKD domain-containing protein, partial [Bacteroidales bacterium]|nr:PKD domain-containing protein [Bacteroidales bacterium]
FDDPLSGANNTSSLQNPDHLFSVYGIYNVQLVINTSSACSDTIIKQVTISQIPPVDFEASPACLNELTYFYVDTTVTNPDIITIWHWDFGDGNYSNIQNPSHLYGSDGDYEVRLTVTDTNACTNNVSHTVIVRPLPVPFFDYSSPACLNDSVYFNDQSYTEYGYIEQWIWDYDDGSDNDTINFPDDPNVYHTFPLTGVFGVTLEVKNSLGCVDSYTRDVTIYPNPVANFYYSDACENEPVDFEDASSPIGPGNIISWYWDFGDPLSGIANTSDLQNPSHLFSSYGIYEVTLIIVNYTQCSDTIIKEVNVKEIPAVDFLYDITCQNQETQFYADSIITNTNSIANWLWDFGDGSTSTLQNPVHIYLLGGDYNVVLSVTDTSGCSNSISHLVTIHSSPEVYFDFSTPCCENNEIEFIDLSSTSSGYICEWIWDFGDGTGDTINYPNSGNTTHIYSQAGNYLVVLSVTTTDSCFNSDSQTILISSSPIADYDYEGQCYNEPVQFYDQSIPNGGINIYQWYWDFGDPLSGANNYSYDPNPVHLFTQAGSYEVMLQVTNVGECTDTITQTVDVSEIPDVEFTYSDTNCLGNTTYFYIDTAIVNTSIIAQYIWDFGDGTNYSYQQNPTHIYEFTGDYNVILTVTDLDGCSNSVSHIVTVNPLPFAVFSYSPACENDTTFFTDHSYIINGEPLISWFWDFGDPGSGPDNYSTLQDPYHIYTQMATYDVKLIVNSESGCMDSIIMQLVVNPLPYADFIYHADACENGLVYFTDLSSGWQTVITEWLWEFEPGYYSTSMNPVYNFYNTDTTYVVSLTVTDGHGCENTKTDSVYIPAGLIFDIEYTAACFGDPTLFNALIVQPVGDSLISFSWDFGEPESGPLNYSNEENPSHTYLEAGYYTVSLAAMDINGCVDTVYRQIAVNELPEPDFYYETFICDSNIYFTDISNGNGAPITYWEWDFGDGQDTTYNVFAPVITHNYQNPGFYNVELLVINNNDCSDTIIKEVYREQCLKSVFNILDTLCCQRFNISFSDSSFHQGIITEWKWDFGDGQDTTYNVF